jgi:hypothetical protein
MRRENVAMRAAQGTRALTGVACSWLARFQSPLCPWSMVWCQRWSWASWACRPVSMAWARCLAYGLAPARSSARHSASSAERLAVTASSQWPLNSCPYWYCMSAQSWPLIMPGPVPGIIPVPGW